MRIPCSTTPRSPAGAKVPIATTGNFEHGVASGFPRPKGAVLWSRVSGLDRTSRVNYEVAEDAGFRKVVDRGRVHAFKNRDFTLHAEVGGLKPSSEYHYRFWTGEKESPVGRLRTAPDPRSKQPVRVGFYSCQSYEAGYFNALGALAREPDLDLVLCLGDYIYEQHFYEGPEERRDTTGSNGDGDVQTLAEYREKYHLYQSDPDLQAMHATHPFIAVWDDHEVEENNAGRNPSSKAAKARPPTGCPAVSPTSSAGTTATTPSSRRTRASASKERLGRFTGVPASAGWPTCSCSTSASFGISNPATTRSRSPAPIPRPRRDLLGSEQKGWLKQSLSSSNATWKLLGNQIMLMGFDAVPGLTLNVDGWDGYAAERREILGHVLANDIDNVVSLVGDVHTFFAGTIHPSGASEHARRGGRAGRRRDQLLRRQRDLRSHAPAVRPDRRPRPDHQPALGVRELRRQGLWGGDDGRRRAALRVQGRGDDGRAQSGELHAGRVPRARGQPRGRAGLRARRAALAALLAFAALASGAAPASAAEKPIEIGVGRADITPPTGYFTFGYVRSDSVGRGALGRLWARAIVIKQGREKIALVSEDLGGIPGGMLQHAVEQIGRPGYSERNVFVSASHTHSGPAGFFNFDTYNTVFMTLNSPTDFSLGGGFDPDLYGLQTERLALAIRRADNDLAPGRLGWGLAKIFDLTENRSIEPHLRDHGIEGLSLGEGSPEMDPEGAAHTVDSNANVLRVDKRIGGEWEPVGIWSNYPNHGTVVHFQFTYWNADHHGPATVVSENRIRNAGDVPASQEVVNVMGNGNEGDMSSALTRAGPAAADYVGRVEAAAFMRAWRRAGQSMTRRPEIDSRWTRMCFCGQDTSAGEPVADEPEIGLAQFTGSDEARGPLFDVTGVPFEGITGPDTGGPHGNKVSVPLPLNAPDAVPLAAIRIGDRLIATVPGEMTIEMGRRVRAAIEAAGPEGIERSMIMGLTNEFVNYFTTPEEYEAQFYEGAATVYGRASGHALLDVLGELSGAMAAGKPGPEPFAFDQTNGIAYRPSSFPEGAASATPLRQPATARRLGHPRFEWQGAPGGFDMPAGDAFITVQRRAGDGRWLTADDDLGLRILWGVDEEGRYFTRWEPPLNAPTGTYRFRIDGTRYGLTSEPFGLRPLDSIVPEPVEGPAGKTAVVLAYPPAFAAEEVGDPPGDPNADLTFRPSHSRGGLVSFLVDGEPVEARVGRGGVFSIAAPPSARVEIEAGAAEDQYGNFNGEAIVLRP